MRNGTDPTAKILVLSPDRDDRRALVQLLKQVGGCAVVSTSAPDTVPTLLEKRQPDLVLLDLRGGIAEELGLLRQLRAGRPSDSFFPVVAVTRSLSVAEKAQLIAAGVSDYLAEPFDAWDIVVRLGNLLDLRRVGRRLHEQDTAVEEGLGYLAGQLQDTHLGVLESIVPRAVPGDGTTGLRPEPAGHSRRRAGS